MKEKMKSKVATIFIVLLFAGVSVYWLFSGISGLIGMSTAKSVDGAALQTISSGDYVEMDDCYIIGTALSIQHKLNFLFRTGSDSYVMVVPKDVEQVFIIKTYTNTAKEFSQGQIASFKGKAFEPDSRISSDITELIDSVSGEKGTVNVNVCYIDTVVKGESTIKIIEGAIVVFIFSLILAAYLRLKKEPVTNNIGNVTIIEQKSEPAIAKLFSSKPAGIFFLALLLVFMFLLVTKSYVLFPGTGVYY